MTGTPTSQPRSLPPRPAASPQARRGGWMKASAATTAAYALLLALLVIIIYTEDHSVLVPLVVFSAAGFAVAAAMAVSGRRSTAWAAVGYSLIALAADGPHQIPEILHPQSADHTAGAVVLIAGGLASLGVALRAARG